LRARDGCHEGETGRRSGELQNSAAMEFHVATRRLFSADCQP
jgi:hypothetical protein